MASSNVKLWLSFYGVAKLALSIPLAEYGTFAVNPLKWLRFLGYSIYGQEGYLSKTKAGPQINDYTANVEARSYYFISEGEPRLVDVDALDDRTSNANDLYECDFRARLISRDGTCVITGDLPRNCIACHIIPHSKGDDYMSNAVSNRGGTGNDVDGLAEIDDSRNGLLLNIQLHRALGDGEAAFLKTPNFAMTVDDIPYNPPIPVNSPTSRFTWQYFVGDGLLGSVLPTMAPRNSDARQPEDTTEWPPAVIVDLFYACAALKSWGPTMFSKYVREQTRDVYYVDAGDGDSASDDHPLGGGSGYTNAPTVGQESDRSRRDKARTGDSMGTVRPAGEREEMSMSDWMDGIKALWMQAAREGKQKLSGARASDLSRKEDDIKTWLQSTEC